MNSLIQVCACEGDLGGLKGFEVSNVSDFTTSSKKEGVMIDFVGKCGEKVSLSIEEGSLMHITPAQFPLYSAQDLRDYEGYTIKYVQSDDNDCDCKVYLENADGNTVILLADKALDGETLFIEEVKGGQPYV